MGVAMFWLGTVWLIVMGGMAACGEDDGEGGAPDLLLGASGLVILVLVIWGVVRAIRKSKG